MGKTKAGVELRRLTQEELLEEAKQTEIINKASLERMLRQEEEKRKVRRHVPSQRRREHYATASQGVASLTQVVVRNTSREGPRVKFHSTRQGAPPRRHRASALLRRPCAPPPSLRNTTLTGR